MEDRTTEEAVHYSSVSDHLSDTAMATSNINHFSNSSSMTEKYKAVSSYINEGNSIVYTHQLQASGDKSY